MKFFSLFGNFFAGGGDIMNAEVDTWMTNVYLKTVAFFSVSVVALIVFLAIFGLITKYKDWEEIKKGNVAAAMATGGKIFGISNIFRFAILNNDTLGDTLIWSSVGFVLLLVAYFVFDFLTPFFKTDEEIKKDNRAVGLITMIISVSMSYIIGASVT
jgi:putative membrane protein